MRNRYIFTLLFILAVSIVPLLVLGAASAGTSPASQGEQQGGSFFSWIGFFYSFLLSVAAILAVFMLVLAGVEMMTAVEKWRTDAKQRIWNALLGLLLAALSFVILKTIDPQFLNLKLNPVEVTGPPGPTPPPAPDNPNGWCKRPSGSCLWRSKDFCENVLSGTFLGGTFDNPPAECS